MDKIWIVIFNYSIKASLINSVSDGMYWTIVTMTTCGYGDKIPLSYLGKLIGVILAIAGVMILALPTALVGLHFFKEK